MFPPSTNTSSVNFLHIPTCDKGTLAQSIGREVGILVSKNTRSSIISLNDFLVIHDSQENLGRGVSGSENGQDLQLSLSPPPNAKEMVGQDRSLFPLISTQFLPSWVPVITPRTTWLTTVGGTFAGHVGGCVAVFLESS